MPLKKPLWRVDAKNGDWWLLDAHTRINATSKALKRWFTSPLDIKDVRKANQHDLDEAKKLGKAEGYEDRKLWKRKSSFQLTSPQKKLLKREAKNGVISYKDGYERKMFQAIEKHGLGIVDRSVDVFRLNDIGVKVREKVLHED